MAFDNINSKNRLPFEPAMREAAGLFLDSLWQDRIKPLLFSPKHAHYAAQRAGTEAFIRLAAVDPHMDAAYESV